MLRDSILTACAVALATSVLAEGATPSAAEAKGAPAVASAEKTITLRPGRSQEVSAPWLIKRVAVLDPTVADIQVTSSDAVLVVAKEPGSTEVFLWSPQDEVWKARVEVVDDLDDLEAAMRKMLPDSRIDLARAGGVLIVSGSLARAEQAKELEGFLEALKQASPTRFQFVNKTRLVGVQQVQIQVRVAEVSRKAIRALSVNAFQVGEDAFGAMTIGSAVGGALNPINLGVPKGSPALPGIPFAFNEDVNPSPLVTLFGGLPEQDLMVFIQALSENQYLRLLAEPNLVALSGEESSFLAGGEYPIPVVQGGTAQSTAISIEYRQFGVRLTFRPTVLGDGLIRLRVAPEVSEVSDTGAVEIQGFRIPGLLARRAETTLELRSGQSFAMAGLLSSKKDARNSRIPLLGDLPILGVLFRSTRYESGETELVVIATASLVEPMNLVKAAPLPGTIELPLEDWEIFLKANFEGKTPGVPERKSPGILEPLKLDGLKGPGAWTTHSKGLARSDVGTVTPVPTSGPAPAGG